MAVTRGRSPVVMTAVGDHLSDPNDQPRRWKVIEIRVQNAGAAGTVRIEDDRGATVFASNTLGVNDVDGTTWSDWYQCKDLIVDELAAGAEVLVYYA